MEVYFLNKTLNSSKSCCNCCEKCHIKQWI